MALFGPPNVAQLKAKRDVAGLAKALGYQKSDGTRASAAEALGDLGDARAVNLLGVALRDRATTVRTAAFHALCHLGAPAIPTLILLLDEEPWRMRAAEALGQLKEPQAVDPLIRLLSDPDGQVRQAAARALGNIGGAEVIELLSMMLRDPDHMVGGAAAEALDRLGWVPDGSALGACYWIVKGNLDKCVEIGAPAVGPLIATFHSTNPRVPRSRVDRTLAEICAHVEYEHAGAQVFARFLSILQTEESARDCETAAHSLAQFGAPVIEPMFNALRQGQVRSDCVLQILGQIKDERAIKALVSALYDSNPLIRCTAAEPLGVLGDARASVSLCAALRDEIAFVRHAAALALGDIGEPRAIGALVGALDDPERKVRTEAVAALVKIYRRAGIDSEARHLILAQRAKIEEVLRQDESIPEGDTFAQLVSLEL